MTRTSSATLAVLAGALLGAVTLAGPAYAGSNLHIDATGDSISTSSATSEEYLPASDHFRGDISTARVTHRGTTVKVELQFSALARLGTGAQYAFAFRTPKGLVRKVLVHAGPGRWAGSQAITNARGTRVRCRGLAHTIAYGGRTLNLTVPRSCLGSPSWVRVAAGSTTIEHGVYYHDDAYRYSYLPTPAFGPRVRH
ncbi:MAG: hypothetical protein ACJ72E_01225 [Marmoricola sp.]